MSLPTPPSKTATAVDALLAAYDRCSTAPSRVAIGEALVQLSPDDERTRTLLVRLLDDDPLNASRLLGDRGDPDVLPDLLRAFDRHARSPVGDCDVCNAEHLGAIASAVDALAGALSEAQERRLDEAFEKASETFRRAGPPGMAFLRLRPERPRTARPGRNDPCPCGSGKKFKKCCLDGDQRSPTH